jgi:Holliday junction resolvase RusA-like endonuclease
MAEVRLVRHSATEPDWDNMVSSFKPIIDALETLRVIENDKMSVIGQPSYRWHKAPRGHGYIEVAVWTPEPPQGRDCSERD